MKLSIQASALRAALDLPTRSAESGKTIPILGCLRLEAADGVLTIAGTDMARFVEHRVTCEVNEPGALCVPASRLIAAVGAVPKGARINIGVSRTYTHMTLASERGRSRLAILPASDYPVVSAGDAEPALFSGGHLAKALRLGARSTKRGHAAIGPLGAVLLDGVEDGVRVVASDGVYMISVVVPCEHAERFGSALLSTEAADLIARLGDDVSLAATKNHWTAVAGDIRATGSLVDHVYPDWRRLITATQDKTVASFELDGPSWVQALESVQWAAQDETRTVFIELSTEGVATFAVAGQSDGTSATARASVVTDSGQFIAYNGELLARAIAALGGRSITLAIPQDGIGPGVMRPVDGGDSFAMIVGLRHTGKLPAGSGFDE